jgi:hypothetical protein
MNPNSTWLRPTSVLYYGASHGRPLRQEEQRQAAFRQQEFGFPKPAWADNRHQVYVASGNAEKLPFVILLQYVSS